MNHITVMADMFERDGTRRLSAQLHERFQQHMHNVAAEEARKELQRNYDAKQERRERAARMRRKVRN